MAHLDELLRAQKDNSASDLHLSPGNPPLLRIHGEIHPMGTTPWTADQIWSLIHEVLSPEQREIFAASHDLDFAYEVPTLNARFRGNAFFGRLGPSAVFRLIPSQILSAEQLGLPAAILNFARLKKGLVLVTGATGSGKSTTLAAMVDYINKTRKEHILTIEDPIEFVHTSRMSLVNQREVGPHTRSFATALRAALREDPDVILVGEMRDLETVELAITAAETGHLVLATLHTSTAAKTVDRLINVFPPEQQTQIRLMASESLKGVVAQNLIKSSDGRRVAAFEILVNNSAISSLIREGKTHHIPGTMQTSKAEGMILMEDALKEHLRAGRITMNEALKYASSTFYSNVERPESKPLYTKPQP